MPAGRLRHRGNRRRGVQRDGAHQFPATFSEPRLEQLQGHFPFETQERIRKKMRPGARTLGRTQRMNGSEQDDGWFGIRQALCRDDSA